MLAEGNNLATPVRFARKRAIPPGVRAGLWLGGLFFAALLVKFFLMVTTLGLEGAATEFWLQIAEELTLGSLFLGGCGGLLTAWWSLDRDSRTLNQTRQACHNLYLEVLKAPHSSILRNSLALSLLNHELHDDPMFAELFRAELWKAISEKYETFPPLLQQCTWRINAEELAVSEARTMLEWRQSTMWNFDASPTPSPRPAQVPAEFAVAPQNC